VHLIKAALRDIPIVYPEGTRYETLSRREIMYQDLETHPWWRLALGVVVTNDYDKDCPIDEKLIVPADLAEIWQQSTLNGNVFATYIGDIVQSDHIADSKSPIFTPQLFAWILLLITLLLIAFRVNGWKWVLLGIQCFVGLFLLYMALFTQLFTSAGWLMMVLFNPLPLLLWKWRKYWQLPYAVLLLIETIILVCWPHMLVDPAYIVLLLSYIVLFSWDTLKQIYVRRQPK
jgi:ABC-type multidrug transport system fused ATPase/permease subunit